MRKVKHEFLNSQLPLASLLLLVDGREHKAILHCIRQWQPIKPFVGNITKLCILGDHNQVCSLYIFI